MRRVLTIAAAAAVTTCAVAYSNPGHARFFDRSLAKAAPAQVQDASHWRRDRWRPWHRHYGWSRRHRDCWYERVRVRTPYGYFVWRTVRRCSWR